MWYIIQTKTGEEERVVSLIDSMEVFDKGTSYLIPMYEHVQRSSSKYNIYIRKLFPGYIFVETGTPKEFIMGLRRIPEFTRFLGIEKKDDRSKEQPVGPIIGVEREDIRFLESILTDGMLHVSLIKMQRNRVEKVVGPLSEYAGHITRLDVQHRRAIVEKHIFGKRRKLYFGLWTEGDPAHPWIQELIKGGNQGSIIDEEYDIGIYPGDIVYGSNGFYEDTPLKVLDVDAVRRRVTVEVSMFGENRSVLMAADDVKKELQ